MRPFSPLQKVDRRKHTQLLKMISNTVVPFSEPQVSSTEYKNGMNVLNNNVKGRLLSAVLRNTKDPQ